MSINTDHNISVVSSTLKDALEALLANGKEKKDSDFMAAYPTLQQYIIRGISQRAALAIFNQEYGHNVQLPRFRQLLKAEKVRRERDGDTVCCPTCGHAPETADSNEEAGA